MHSLHVLRKPETEHPTGGTSSKHQTRWDEMDFASCGKTGQWQEGAEISFQSSKPWNNEQKWTSRVSKNDISEVMLRRRYRKITLMCKNNKNTVVVRFAVEMLTSAP